LLLSVHKKTNTDFLRIFHSKVTDLTRTDELSPRHTSYLSTVNNPSKSHVTQYL